MKLAIITAMHGRPEVTKAFCMASARIKKDTGVETFSAVTRNDNVNIGLCEQYGIRYTEQRNDPLGLKWNQSLWFANQESDFTHIVILGSDDIASTTFIEHQLTLEEYDLAGVNDLWFWGMNPKRDGYKKFGYFRNKINGLLGVGRLVGRNLLEMLGGSPWESSLNVGLDRSLIDKVRPLSENTLEYSLLDEDLFIVDIKRDLNVSSMAPALRTMEIQDVDSINKYLPEDEVEYLKSLV